MSESAGDGATVDGLLPFGMKPPSPPYGTGLLEPVNGIVHWPLSMDL